MADWTNEHLMPTDGTAQPRGERPSPFGRGWRAARRHTSPGCVQQSAGNAAILSFPSLHSVCLQCCVLSLRGVCTSFYHPSPRPPAHTPVLALSKSLPSLLAPHQKNSLMMRLSGSRMMVMYSGCLMSARRASGDVRAAARPESRSTARPDIRHVCISDIVQCIECGTWHPGACGGPRGCFRQGATIGGVLVPLYHPVFDHHCSI